MMYPPKHHTEENLEKLFWVIEEFPFATLISYANNDIVVTHIPLMLKRAGGDKAFLVGHMDRNNPHLRHLENGKAFVIFHGPNCYITPNVYESSQLPTWNSISVHIRGKVKIVDSCDFLRDSIIQMVEYLESGENPYVLSTENEKMNAWLRYIVGFRIDIEEIIGRFKLSQDKNANDIEGAKLHLIEQNQKSHKELIEKLINNK